MAIKVSGTEVVSNTRELKNIASIDAATASAIGAVIETDPTRGSLTKSFASDETASITLSQAVSPAPVVSVVKEVPQLNISTKGRWDVDATASNYELFYETPSTGVTIGAWNISVAVYSKTRSINAEEGVPVGVSFKPDGTKMYVLGSSGDDVNEYSLSTPWDIVSASYVTKFLISGQDTAPGGIHFKPDGTKMYIAGSSTDSIHEYNLSTAWDVSSASYVQSLSIAGQELTPSGVFFKTDGTKMYLVGYIGDTVFEYDLSTPWSVSSASLNQSFSVAAQDLTPSDLFFKPDGTKMYFSGMSTDAIFEYSLSTPWDVSSASYIHSFSVAAQDLNATGLFFKPDGTKFFIAGNDGNAVDAYDIPVLAVLDSGSFSESDVGKRIFVDDGGQAIIKSSTGEVAVVSEFASDSYASGNWSLSGLDVDATNGITISGITERAYDLAAISYNGVSFSVASQDSSMASVVFKPDGSKMYVAGASNLDLFQYSLSIPWDVSSASYDGISVDVSAQAGGLASLAFNDDGTKIYVLEKNSDSVFQYSVAVPWVLSDVTYDGVSFSVASQDTIPQGITFKPDGTKMYMVGSSGDYVSEYDLSTAWDLSSASYLRQFFVRTQEGDPLGVSFKPDGTKMYVIGAGADRVYEYPLSTPWDVSSASYNATSYYVGGNATIPAAVLFDSIGNNMYIADIGSSTIYQYSVGENYQPTGQYIPALTSTAGQIDSTYWTDLNSMTADDADNSGQVYYAVSTDNRTTWSVIKEGDGVRPIVRNNAGTWQYNSNDGNPDAWNVAAASYNQVLDIGTQMPQEVSPTGLFLKPDGTKLYGIGIQYDRVFEFDIATPWDLSTATYSQVYYVSGQEVTPRGLFFSGDGTKMYHCGLTGDAIYEYSLSTAWDISSSSYVRSLSTVSQDSAPMDVFFKPDGLKMYLVGSTNDSVHEYNLSVAWDISTASASQSYSVATQDISPTGVFFKSDGTSMYINGAATDTIYQYSLSIAWDISSASLSGSISVSAQDTSPANVYFSPDGSRMYFIGSTGDNVYGYSIGTPTFTTSTTWNNAATNNEHAALSEALTQNAYNRMDKVQLGAVTDPNHYPLGNSLDLMIALHLPNAGVAPTSDGVTINYDAEVLNRAAVLGTDYDYDFPNSTTVRITSNSAQNLKIRVV